MKIFIPITKVDAAKRLVYGTLTEEVADKSGEILDYESAKPAFKKWSDDQIAASGGKSKGNLRAMHGKVAAGKFTDITFDDVAKKVHGVAHVVDDAEWAKVEAGVYTGFSIGGSYAKLWNDPVNPALKRFTPVLSEVSIVDSPCVGSALFQYIKADGSVELRKFNHEEETMKKTETAPAEKPAEAPAAEAPVAEAPVVEKTESPQEEDGIEKGFRAKDGSFHMEKADAQARNIEHAAEQAAAPLMDALKNLETEVTKAEGDKPVVDAAAAPAAETKVEAAKADAANDLAKGMYSVGTLADLLTSLTYLQQDAAWEATIEGDGSTVPAKLKACAMQMAEILKEMVGEEVDELMAAKAAGGDLTKKGAMLSAANKAHMQTMMDSAKGHMDAVTKCCTAMGLGKDAEDDADKSVPDTMGKTQASALQKALDDAVPLINSLVKRVAELEKQPMPPKGVARVVEKNSDGSGNAMGGDEIQKMADLIKGKSPEEVSMILLKAALNNPQPGHA